MGSLLCLILVMNVVILLVYSSSNVDSQEIESPRLLDHVVRDYAFGSYMKQSKTGFIYKVHLPVNLSGIGADTVRFRCGSLRRYGAQVKEFSLVMGVIVRHCVERVVVVRQNLGMKWSYIYYDSYNFSGYQLVSPVLGLLVYNADDLTQISPSELEMPAGKKPILIDFSEVISVDTPGISPSCASLGSDGKVSLSDQVTPNMCVALQQGHFALVIKSSPSMPQPRSSKVSRWKVIVGSSVGSVLGAFLLGLLLVALLVKAKKRSRMAEMERRAYEEEALQMSMVGHVRAPTAAGTRTLPTLEHEYTPP